MTIRKPSTEHSPMSAFDEYPIHQIGQPVRVVATTDARAYERYWFTAHDLNGEFFLAMGIGFYPNLGTADCYAVLSEGTTHTHVRAHKTLDEDRSTMEIGPFRFQMVKPFEEWHLTLASNDHGMEVDIRWFDAKRAVFNSIDRSNISGRLPTYTAGYETFGEIEGTIRVGDRTLILNRERTRGSRDHHWGIRNGVGGPALSDPVPAHTYVGQWTEFSDFGIWFQRLLLNKGDPRPGAIRIVKQERKLRFDPVTHHLTGGIIYNYLGDGSVKEVHYEQIPNRVVYLRFGMYTGADGRGEPQTGLYHGSYAGEEVLVGGGTHDISDPNVRIEIGGFENHLMRATCDGEETIGVLEVLNPLAWEYCRDGVNGFALAD